MFPTITSPHNPRVKEAARLRDRRGRSRQGRIIIDGLREVRRAWEAGIQVTEVFLCDARVDSETQALAEAVADVAEVSRVRPDVFRKLAFGDRNEQLVAVAQTPRVALVDLVSVGSGPVVVLEAVEKPGNVGAVLRTADAAGAAAVIVADGGTDLYNPNAIRASLGAIFCLPLATAGGPETLAWLRERRLPIFAARVGGAMDYTAAPLGQPCAILLGSEAEGLSELWRGPDIQNVGLPMLGVVDSLNVSTTAAVLLYDALRQRGT
jgi:TrmH family RNA methyltransferase